MSELTWKEVDFNEGFNINRKEIDKLINNSNYTIERVSITIGTAILILGGLLIIAWAGIQLYQTYTTDSQIKEALQMAKDENRQIHIFTSNSYSIRVNVTSKSSLSIAGNNAAVTRITVYPKNYRTEQIILPNGNILTPYSLD